MVSPAQVVPAAPAPLASIRDQVANDWINDQATAARRGRGDRDRRQGCARGAARRRRSRKRASPLPPVRPMAARRIQIATRKGQVPPPMQMLFTLGQGKSRMVADPQGRGFFVVKVDKIMPGNALLAAGLISQMQSELQQTASRRNMRSSSWPRCART